MKIKNLPEGYGTLEGLAFKHPETGKTVYWASQWGNPDGKAGVWVNEKKGDTKVHPIFLDSLKDALEFEVVEE